MKLAWDDEDEAFRAAARTWLLAHMPRTGCPASGSAARAFATGWVRTLHDGGWSGIAWPRDYGGRGLSRERQFIWYEEYARAGAPSPLDPSFVGLNHAGPTLMACGSPEQKAYHLPRILSGAALWCQGFSEPGAGSDLASLTTSGRIDGDRLIVNGRKIWTSFADVADFQELLLRTTPGSRRTEGLSWAICDMHAPGITVRPIETLAGTSHFCEVTYDDVAIPLANVVGAIGDGWRVAMTTLGFERGTAAVALQLALVHRIEALRALALAHAAAAGPALIDRIASARAEALALRALTYETFFRTPDSAFAPSLVRLAFAELAQRIHRIGAELCEACDLDPAQAAPLIEDWLESYSETIAGGTAEIQRNIIAERLLGLPRQARP